MLPATATPDTILIRYDATAAQLTGHWPAEVTDGQLRRHYAELLATAQAHGNCRFWFLDMRGRNWHTPDFGQWFGTHFAAAARATLGVPIFIAYVLSPEQIPAAKSLTTSATQRACVAHEVYPFFFDTEAAARE